MKFISRKNSDIIIVPRGSRTNHRGLLLVHLSILETLILLLLIITVLLHVIGDAAIVTRTINKDESDNPYEYQQYSTSFNTSGISQILNKSTQGQKIPERTKVLNLLNLPKSKRRQQTKYYRDKWISSIAVNKSHSCNSIVNFETLVNSPTTGIFTSTELIGTYKPDDREDFHKFNKTDHIQTDNLRPKRDVYNSILDTSKNIHNINESDIFPIQENIFKNHSFDQQIRDEFKFKNEQKAENFSVINNIKVKKISNNNNNSEDIFYSSTTSQQQFDSIWTTTIYTTQKIQSNLENVSIPCNYSEDENCVIDHNITCVGEPAYCNLTYEEYIQFIFDYIYPTVPEWILIFSHLVVFIMGLVGNALVCIAVYTNHYMRTVTNIFIVNLAVADFFVILFCLPPTVVWDVTETWFMGKVMCKIVLYFQNVSVTVSVLTLTFISIDRWYAICFPLRYRTKISRAIASIAFIWLVALISDIPELIVLTTIKREVRFDLNLFTQCEPTWDLETEKNFYITRFIMLYTLPLLLMTVAYFKIVRVLWKSETIPGHRESRNHQYQCGYLRGTGAPSANTSTMGQLRARRKAAKMLVAVVVMFASCYFPVHVLNILRYTTAIGQDHSDVVTVFALFSHWLCYANSAINPVIYNFMSGKFRREFRNALEKCRCARRRVEDRSLNHSNPTSRLNNISQSTRSNYQLTSLRDITTRETQRQIAQTTFADAYGNGHSATPMLNNHVQMEKVP